MKLSIALRHVQRKSGTTSMLLTVRLLTRVFLVRNAVHTQCTCTRHSFDACNCRQRDRNITAMMIIRRVVWWGPGLTSSENVLSISYPWSPFSGYGIAYRPWVSQALLRSEFEQTFIGVLMLRVSSSLETFEACTLHPQAFRRASRHCR